MGPRCQGRGLRRSALLPVLRCAPVLAGRTASRPCSGPPGWGRSGCPGTRGARFPLALRQAPVHTQSPAFPHPSGGAWPSPSSFRSSHPPLSTPPHPASDPVKTSGAAGWSEFPEPPEGAPTALGEHSFGLTGPTAVLDETGKRSLRTVTQSQRPKTEGKLPFSSQFPTQGFVSLNRCWNHGTLASCCTDRCPRLWFEVSGSAAL